MVPTGKSYDKNNVQAVETGIASLRKNLKMGEENQNNQEPPSVNYGSCSHGGIVNISKPFVVQLNWLDLEDGGKTLSQVPIKICILWAPLTTDARMMNLYRSYPTYDDLLLYKGATEKVFTKNPSYNNYGLLQLWQGGGVIMFNNSLYYNCYNTRDICKYNINTTVNERRTLPDATFNNRFSYASSVWQDIDLASDEDGLWVIYSTEQNAGNIVISKLNPLNLTVEKTWMTSQYKLGATNAFMVCGVLYATRTLSTRKEEVFYMYDTKTSQEGQISIILDKMMERTCRVSPTTPMTTSSTCTMMATWLRTI
ncbi:unnamed protein product [Ranitomeya imitator]|uniref:Olfactomedin-like domain-containing protein n=1 Tax=Ranitomeya imitator TaxID=111125 RepID=A0ABN9MIP9_9NEOB|nr:unnamed protein product [Ranitomeya imitator]